MLTHLFTSLQVHALNILRALYRDTRLGENIIPFVSDGVQAAVLGFTSPVWAVSLHLSQHRGSRTKQRLLCCFCLPAFILASVRSQKHMSVHTTVLLQVRNSSTLLFSTLITRIFGVKKGKDEHSKKNRCVPSPFLTACVICE